VLRHELIILRRSARDQQHPQRLLDDGHRHRVRDVLLAGEQFALVFSARGTTNFHSPSTSSFRPRRLALQFRRQQFRVERKLRLGVRRLAGLKADGRFERVGRLVRLRRVKDRGRLLPPGSGKPLAVDLGAGRRTSRRAGSVSGRLHVGDADVDRLAGPRRPGR